VFLGAEKEEELEQTSRMGMARAHCARVTALQGFIAVLPFGKRQSSRANVHEAGSQILFVPQYYLLDQIS
jgi:hypothetical protein